MRAPVVLHVAGRGPYTFIMAMLLAALFYLPWLLNAAFALRLPALHGTSGGATMTTAGGAGTPTRHSNLLRARLTGFYHGVGALTLRGSGLILSLAALYGPPPGAAFALPRPDALIPSPAPAAWLAYNTRR